MNKKKMPRARLLGLTFVIAGVLFGLVSLLNHENPAVYLPITLLSVAVGVVALLRQKKE